jgi:hypothetical protein
MVGNDVSLAGSAASIGDPLRASIEVDWPPNLQLLNLTRKRFPTHLLDAFSLPSHTSLNVKVIMADTELDVAVVALVISLIALVISTQQLLMELLGSADGYCQCAESVSGSWHRKRKRVWT